MKPLAIVAYFDGRLGHEKQTRGILQALSDMTPITVETRMAAVAPAVFLRNWCAYFISCLLPGRKKENPLPADLIIGTGSHTHIPMLLDKKSRRTNSGQPVRVVTCMTPDVLLRNQFDLCCIPRHDEPAAGDNVLTTLGPPNPVQYGGRQHADCGLILVGGVDAKSHVWNPAEVLAQVRTIVEKDPAMRWTISSSPRTPEKTCRDLEELAASFSQVTFFRSAATPQGWVEEQYGINRMVWVTADSVSMVYEALSGGCAVGILPVQWLQQDSKFQKSLNILQAEKMIVYFNAWQSGAEMPAPPTEPLHEAKRCAREILHRWWPERIHTESP